MLMKNDDNAKEIIRGLCLEKISQLISYTKDCTIANQNDLLTCEYVCINSDIFRGCFHPSPVIDLIVGNMKRGRKIKGDRDTDKLSYRYLFDANHRLLCVEDIYQGRVGYVEHLFYRDDVRIGITVIDNQKIRSISEECFQDGRIISFARVHCYDLDNEYVISRFEWEKYHYDHDGLAECELVFNFNPQYRIFAFEQYRFERQNGYLTAYITKKGGTRFQVTKKRSALGKGFFFP